MREIFYFQKLILNTNYGKLDALMKISFVNLKEIRKPRGKILSVWAKYKIGFEIFEKNFEFTYENLNTKLIFNPFLSDILDLCHFIQL